MPAIKKFETRNIGEAVYNAGHNFTVDMVPLTLPDGRVVHDKRAVVRTDNGNYLGTVGTQWQPVQPSQLYEMAGQLLSQFPKAMITGAIDMHQGAVLGLAMTLGRNDFLPGDTTEYNFLIMTSFNMSYTMLGRAITNRWFCTNQAASSTLLFDMKHTTFIQRRLSAATEMLGYYNREMLGFQKNVEALVQLRFPEQKAVEWFRGLLTAPKSESKRSETVVENKVGSFVQLLEHGKGTEIPGVRGSGYGAYQALTEYVNFVAPTRVHEGRDAAEVRFETIAFGTGNDLIQKGMKSLLAIAQNPPLTAPIKVN